MSVVETLKRTLGDFPHTTPNPAELERLQRFFEEMKAAGIAKTREYDLPQPDTIGRAALSLPPRDHHARR